MAYSDSILTSNANFTLVAGLINGVYPVWTSYTPTLTPAGSMTYGSTSITYAKYIQIGDFVHVVASFTGTVGGTPSTSIRFTLPVTASTASGCQGAGYCLDNGSNAGAIVLGGTTTAVDVARYNVAAFTAGTVTIRVSLFYEAA